jgi:hypothetical protein
MGEGENKYTFPPWGKKKGGRYERKKIEDRR